MSPTAPVPASIPFFSLPNWLSAAGHCGIDLGAILAEVGVDLATIEPQTTRVSCEAIARAMTICAVETHRRHPDRHFPFVLGTHFVFQYVPDIETFLATCGSLRDAERVFDWVRVLINPHMHQKIVERGGQAGVTLWWQDLPPELNGLFHDCIDMTMAASLKTARLLAGNDFALRSVSLRRTRPLVDARLYEEHFQAPVHFGQDEDAVWFDQHWLDTPLKSALPALHQRAAERVERQIADMAPPEDSLAALLERSLVANPALLSQRLEDVADTLNLHPRTLQRRLREAGQNYSDLQARVRFHLASEWLKEGALSVESISERLGFADRRSFTQAFVRWAKVSPSQFRRVSGFP